MRANAPRPSSDISRLSRFFRRALEPVALDPKKLVTESLEEAKGDLPSAREIIAKKVADTDYK